MYICIFWTYNIASASAFYQSRLQKNPQNHPHFIRLKICKSADPHFTGDITLRNGRGWIGGGYFLCFVFWHHTGHSDLTVQPQRVLHQRRTEDALCGYQSTRHTVISSHGELVTRSTRHRSTRHLTKPPQCRAVRFNYLGFMSLYHIARMISDNSYLWAWKLERNETLHNAHSCPTWQVIAACAVLKSPTTAKLLNATSARSKSTFNSSQRRQTRRLTRHTILRCDELTGFPLCDSLQHKLLEGCEMYLVCSNR